MSYFPVANRGASSKLRLLVWDSSGSLLINEILRSKTISLSGRSDCDVQVSALGDNSVFLRVGVGRISLYFQSETSGNHASAECQLGNYVSCGGLTWSVLDASHEEFNAADVGKDWPLSKELLNWVCKTMVGADQLNAALVEFLDVCLEKTAATSGMLVVANDQEFSLVSHRGLSLEEAHKFWDSMPDQLSQDILKTQARVLLPEGFSDASSAETTVYIRGMKSIVGFPIMAEGRLLAILYLGYANLLRELSSAVQEDLESASALAGLIIQRAQLRAELDYVRSDMKSMSRAFPQGRLMLGSSAAMADVYRQISKVAPVDINVLINGATGTGKELAAREIHRMSQRKESPFIVFNVAATPESLFESELFGYRKGAFTGAIADRKGLFESADQGTLFIDEIGELSLQMQAKLLRVLQEKEITRIGDEKSQSIDFRLVTATHRDLMRMVKSGDFREDLFYRISGARVSLPSLQNRRDDIIELANYFKQQFEARHQLPAKQWSAEAVQLLRENEWQGNVRELEHAVARACVMADDLIIRPRDLRMGTDDNFDHNVSLSTDDLTDDAASLAEAREDWLRAYITDALKRNSGSRAQTAKNLGIGQRTLFRYIEQLNIRGV